LLRLKKTNTGVLAVESQPELDFSDIDCIISAGLPWDSDMLKEIISKKSIYNFKFVQVLYDLIPIKMPELCVEGMVTKFPIFILDALWASDTIYSISKSTENDLIDYAKEIGAPIPNLEPLELGFDLSQKSLNEKPQRFHDLKEKRFILVVSTIEARKNHMLLYNALRILVEEEKDPDPPVLVFVGAQGWRMADSLSIFTGNPKIYPKYLKIYSGLEDDELSWLYKHCSFTAYPSFYEGWGLPITESLAFGKFCLCSSTSSMPEAGKHMVEYIDPYDVREWGSRMSHYWKNYKEIELKEAVISRDFSPVKWSSSVSDFINNINSEVE
jgi:glycosyltransferase involved in cell wall biosynthesis